MKATVHDAAQQLGISSQTLRLWLRSGKCPFGQAFTGSGKNYVYYINSTALNEYLTNKKVASAKATE